MNWTDYTGLEDESKPVPKPEGDGCLFWFFVAAIAVITIILIGVVGL